ncbi:GYF domain-containing mpd2 [Lecanosticta acicola]|uniref:GYF domain-containing mpd2 n=1 Tax=Lecanosticta acicola TaxID=111012 RepID=A0AAI8YS71_9PEZI|nr:GYF domain-containing mpd2 [Lecanosticta acicola]
MAPSTFASAAAGNPQSSSRDGPPSDWSRRSNGSTQTFRRPSGAMTTPTTAHPSDPLPSQTARYVPPHRNGTLSDNRYTKEQLLESFKVQHSVNGDANDHPPMLFTGAPQPDTANGTSATWGRLEHTRDNQPGPDVCWEKGGSVEPLGLIEMDEEERELFTLSVNSPIKPPTATKEHSQANGLPGRKSSISNSVTTPGGFGLPSPSVARGGRGRREASESYPFPQNNVSSPGGFNQHEQRTASPPASLLRRRTDIKDNSRTDDGDDKPSSSAFGTLKRNPTGPLSAGFNAPSTPWSTAGPQSAGLPPMGSFGNFGLPGNASQQAVSGDKRPGLGSGRSESRFKNVLNKESSDDGAHRSLERKTSISSLGRVNENDSWRQERPEPTNATLEEAEEDLPTGSAALAADAEISPPQPRQGYQGFGTPSRQGTNDDFGFGAFGMTSNSAHAFGQGFNASREAFHQQTPSHQRPGQQSGGNEPMSPTDTNPYQSPEHHNADRTTTDMGDDSHEMHNTHLPGLGQFGADQSQQLGGLGALPNLGRPTGAQGPASDRSQTSSVGPGRGGFPGFGGLGTLGGLPGSAAWPVSQGGLGTPSRQTAGLSIPFGGSVFSNPMSDLQSPGLAGLGASTIMSPHSGAYGGSRMASVFPQGLQDQTRHNEHDREGGTDRVPQSFAGLGDIGRSAESPFANQGFNLGQDKGSLHEPVDLQQGQFGAPGQHQQQQSQPQNQPPGSSASNQPPAPQQRTMVMPDRMQWIYRDPQGQTQGPWTGLEMHDWYKAGFFSPELLVKKKEDPDYEPLAQLIRRIGNSREPFLVPQIGIPHGGPSTSAGPSTWPGQSTASGAQPPFASSFPSFGTTLTAEQQNALERRKQEEQYLMARQKEHLAQQQIAQRMQMSSGHPSLAQGQLHHHGSAHSLQSQPSYGSITSPTAFQPSPIQGPTPAAPSNSAQGFFDNSYRSPPAGGMGTAGIDPLSRIREEEIPGILDRLNLGSRAGPGQYGAPGQPFGAQQQAQQQLGPDVHDEQVKQMLDDRARLQQEQAAHDAQQQPEREQPATNERLQRFQQLRGEQDIQHRLEQAGASVPAHPEDTTKVPTEEQPRQPEQPSLKEQVEAAASAKQSPVPQRPGMPEPFPPAPSQSPLPAPAAQRTGRQSVADQLQTESRDLSQTPSVETPSAAVAPWAKEPAEAPKGPSLKEIQEAEAKKAAEVEQMAAAARRAAFQKEMEQQAQASAAAQPSLPTSSTWGAGSPATPTGPAPAAWAKTAQKPTGPATGKTLAQIQKEEEARKRKLAAAATAAQAQAAAVSGVAAPAGSKSYANLAGKVISPLPNTAGGAWTTVGAGGKAKTPLGGPAPSAVRTVSAGVVPTVQPAAPTIKKPTGRSTTTANSSGMNAQEEFKKWAIGELRMELNKDLNPNDVFSGLINLPADLEMITEAVHGVSSTLDSRHFGEEFMRRKRLADKGIIDTTVPKSASPSHAANKGAADGWSQVAQKKRPEETREDSYGNGNFKVVPSKKKGGKR